MIEVIYFNPEYRPEQRAVRWWHKAQPNRVGESLGIAVDSGLIGEQQPPDVPVTLSKLVRGDNFSVDGVGVLRVFKGLDLVSAYAAGRWASVEVVRDDKGEVVKDDQLVDQAEQPACGCAEEAEEVREVKQVPDSIIVEWDLSEIPRLTSLPPAAPFYDPALNPGEAEQP